MSRPRLVKYAAGLIAAIALCACGGAFAQAVAPASPGAFDFDVGDWTVHVWRLQHPLTGSTTWTEMTGTKTVRPIWGGRADLAEVKLTGDKGPLELLALRWYDAKSGQWYLDFATPQAGTLGVPAVGEIKDGRAAFYDQEDYNGRKVLLRFMIWSTGPDTARSEQAYSADGGKTWETNWINEYTRLKR